MRISDWSSDVCSSDLAPAPANAAGHLLIRTTATLISAGTERMLVDFGKSSMLAKARQQPERVKEVLAKVRTDGLVTTLDAVRSKIGRASCRERVCPYV